MLGSMYDAVMNSRKNPLRNLPPVVRFQIMSVLALMWSVVFCTWTGLVYYLGASMAAHAVLLAGIFLTAETFRRAPRTTPASHRDQYRDPADGCAKYDDIWGG